jgi:ribosomal protein S12 methylthiotransferase accessory factor
MEQPHTLQLVDDPYSRLKHPHYGAKRLVLDWLVRYIMRLVDTPVVALAPALSAIDPLLPEIMARARRVQNAGYDVTFVMSQRVPDVPLLHLCTGLYEKKNFNIAGYDFSSPALALAKSLSESVERALWLSDSAYYKPGIRARLKDLTNALDVTRIAGFSTAERANDITLQISEETEFLWSEGVRLAHGTRIHIPSQLISGYYTDNRESEPLLAIPVTNGLATAPTFDEAALRGLLELIERDAFMITFYNRITPSRIAPESIKDTKTNTLLETFSKFKLTVDFLLIPTDMPATVVVCAIRDALGGPALVFGSKAHLNPEQAVQGALAESYALYLMQRSLGHYTRSLPPEPWSMPYRLAFWAKPENTHLISWLFEGSRVSLPDGSKNALNLRGLAHAAETRGCQVGATLMSPPSLQTLGLFSVAVVSPEMHPLTLDSGHLYRGVERLSSLPKFLGYTPVTEPPPYPHPFP